ncbi:MAG TPA: hypothetical protein VM282_20145 [Acidimicrobiales bacterium]|nr:hypothetical protein [Acidimicrobiales bacterium]
MTTNRADPDFDPFDDENSDADDTVDHLGLDGAPMDEDERERAESLAAEMAAVRDRLAQVPAATVVANHAMGLYELGAIHLSQDPPSFSEATIAIDAMAALIDRLPGRLGDDEATLRESLAQLRMAFVMLRDRAAAAAAPSEPPA